MFEDGVSKLSFGTLFRSKKASNKSAERKRFPEELRNGGYKPLGNDATLAEKEQRIRLSIKFAGAIAGELKISTIGETGCNAPNDPMKLLKLCFRGDA